MFSAFGLNVCVCVCVCVCVHMCVCSFWSQYWFWLKYDICPCLVTDFKCWESRESYNGLSKTRWFSTESESKYRNRSGISIWFTCIRLLSLSTLVCVATVRSIMVKTLIPTPWQMESCKKIKIYIFSKSMTIFTFFSFQGGECCPLRFAWAWEGQQ